MGLFYFLIPDCSQLLGSLSGQNLRQLVTSHPQLRVEGNKHILACLLVLYLISLSTLTQLRKSWLGNDDTPSGMSLLTSV